MRSMSIIDYSHQSVQTLSEDIEISNVTLELPKRSFQSLSENGIKSVYEKKDLTNEANNIFDQNLEFSSEQIYMPNDDNLSSADDRLGNPKMDEETSIIADDSSGKSITNQNESPSLQVTDTMIPDVINRPYECESCLKKFLRKHEWTRHLRVHTGEKPYMCDFCGKYFTQSTGLKRHLYIHVGEKPHKCDVCDKRFAKKSDLQRHLFTHRNEPFSQARLRVCNICGTSQTDLNRHMRTHSGEKPFKCEECGKSFAGKSDLKRHLRRHTGEKPRKCHICSKGFLLKCDLQRHIPTHTIEEYQCEACDKVFAKKGLLTKHMSSHSGKKPYRCDICKKEFTRKTELVKHARSHTTKGSTWKCQSCDKLFLSRKALESHVIQWHTKERC